MKRGLKCYRLRLVLGGRGQTRAVLCQAFLKVASRAGVVTPGGFALQNIDMKHPRMVSRGGIEPSTY